jgi:hypothetical protein
MLILPILLAVSALSPIAPPITFTVDRHWRNFRPTLTPDDGSYHFSSPRIELACSSAYVIISSNDRMMQ